MKRRSWSPAVTPGRFQRSPQAASADVGDWSIASLFASARTTAGIQVNEDKSLNYSAVWAATRVLCGTGGSLPLHLYRRVDLASRGLRGEGKERVRGSQLGRVLSWKANDNMDAGRFRRLMWHWQINWGNADAEIIRDDFTGEVVALLPIHPSKVTCETNDRGELRWIIREPNEAPRTLTADQVFHLPNILTQDGIVGIGVISCARESVGFGLATEKYGANWFGKGGIPRLTIEFPGVLNDQLRRSFREEWQAIYGGSNGERVAVLQNGAKANPLDISPEDSQFLETRQYNVEEIARWYGVPPHLIQRPVQLTYNNAEVLWLDFCKTTLLQYLESWEAAINTQLLRPEEAEDVYAKHNENGLLRGDSMMRSQYLKGMVASALMTRNEARAYEELEPVEGGDTFLVQGATVPLDEDGKPVSDFAGTTAPGAMNEEPDDSEEPESLPKPSKAVAAIKRAVYNDLHRMTTKERNEMTRASKAADGFVGRVDEFYVEHASQLITALEPHFEALTACGAEVSLPKFVASWCEEGKSAVLGTAGSVTATNLEPAIRGIVDSRDWTDRPLKAMVEL